jgi:DNA-binding MarR family transcriptional regulator
MESLGLVKRQVAAADRRVTQAIVTAKAKAMTDSVDGARERLGRALFATRDQRDVNELARLMRKFVDAVTGGAPR